MLAKRHFAAIIVGLMVVIILTTVPIVIDTHHQDARCRCQNNLRSLGRTLEIYSSDYGGHFPPVEEADSSPYSSWPKAIDAWSARKSRPLPGKRLKCPSDRTSSTTSYDLNGTLAKQSAAALHERSGIVLLSEKRFRGSHHMVYYLGGNVATRTSEN